MQSLARKSREFLSLGHFSETCVDLLCDEKNKVPAFIVWVWKALEKPENKKLNLFLLNAIYLGIKKTLVSVMFF